MAIVTRCPACSTVFRVAPPQLQARNGMVRCGRCMTVFDGFKTLTNAPEPAASEPAESATVALDTGEPAATTSEPAASDVSVTAAPDPAAATVPVKPDPAPDSPAAIPEVAPARGSAARDTVPAPAPSTEPAFKLEAVSATELAAAATVPATQSRNVEETSDFGPAPEQLTLEDHLFLEETRAAKARVSRLWGAGSALVLLVLGAQAVYFYRGEIAARYPSLRPNLTQLCASMGCVINLPQRPQLIAIEASDLQATDPARPNVIQLTATVRNHAPYDLGFPALDLVLTNSRDHTLARRIFQPRDYLDPSRDTRAGIPPKGEMTISLDLDTADLQPAGFRIDLMAAQTP